MNSLDFVVLISTILGIAAYGMWKTRNRQDLSTYLRGDGRTPWFVIGLSVMATQASAITFLSTPGQGYLNGLGFVQIYFGVPLALYLIAKYFLPRFRRLHVFTAYEYLEKRFDEKTRLLGACLFLIQRGLGAGLTIYAPAIVLTTVFNWPLNATIISCGLLVMLYTVFGGSEAVAETQKYQFAIIFAGMITATVLLISKLPTGLSPLDGFTLAGDFQKLNAVNFSFDPKERYTVWSGLLGGTFMMLSYYGTDQSQVQRYISGASLKESKMGLMFNAICKIPMQLAILSIGVLLFLFYQFQAPPMFFDPSAGKYLAGASQNSKLVSFDRDYRARQQVVQSSLAEWLKARKAGDGAQAGEALSRATAAQKDSEIIKGEARKELLTQNPDAKANDADYVFITFILRELPHGAIGLLVAAFFAAALSSKSAELNALGASTTIDFYRRLFATQATDAQYLTATKWFTAFWGIVAIVIALCARLAENLIQAVNILGSVFYGVMLGLFVVAFFLRRVGGNVTFWGAVIAQILVFVLYFTLGISYLWYPLIGCVACVAISLMLQAAMGPYEKHGPRHNLEHTRNQAS